MNPTIKVAVSSKTLLMRTSLTKLLQDEKELQVIFNAANKEEIIGHLKYKLPDVMVMSIEKTERNILQTVMALKDFPQVKLIVLIEKANDALILKLLELGVKAILTNEANDRKLIETIKEVYSKGFYYTSEVMHVIDRRVSWLSDPPSSNFGITTREAEVLHLVCQGKSSKQIGELLFISTKTVENHRYSLIKKMGDKGKIEIH